MKEQIVFALFEENHGLLGIYSCMAKVIDAVMNDSWGVRHYVILDYEDCAGMYGFSDNGDNVIIPPREDYDEAWDEYNLDNANVLFTIKKMIVDD